jgi:hypothetical protein
MVLILALLPGLPFLVDLLPQSLCRRPVAVDPA